ncbi:MAG: peptidase MA family metallohydrolase [Chloroflexota bacterium]
MGGFVVVYPLGFTRFSTDLVNELSTEINQMLVDYRKVFKTNLLLPITLRIYPLHDDFYCLNPQTPFLGEGTAHSRAGTREIALFLHQIREEDSWQPAVLNGVRHELAVLFAGELSGGFAPPGLLNGLGGYFEDPGETFTSRFEAGGRPQEAELNWKVLWEENAPLSDQRALLQSTSTVAYLVDVYGWEKFIDFLKEINHKQGYHEAAAEVYGSSIQGLEEHWETYFPVYLDHRWQVNIFHAYDLDVIRQLLDAGAYQESVLRLDEAVFIIEIFGNPDELIAAQGLLAKAKLGVEADQLTLQARDALLSGEYKESYTAGALALDLFQQLGDTRRVSELEAYLAVSKEVLDLRAGLDLIRQQGIGINPFRSKEILSIGQRLLALGDTESGEQVLILLSLLGIQQNTYFQFLISLVILVCTGLIIRQAISARKPYPVEADLL